jgi:hypothetical protein
MKLLKKLSQHCAILLTIHQPSSQIFFLFDVIIYMKDGRIFYQGPVKEMCEFYSARGYSCPDNFNPSDFIMDLCQAHTSKDLDEKGLFQPIPEQYTNFDQAESSLRFNESDLIFHFESSFGKQLSFLAHREVINTIRDIHTTFFKFFLTFVMMFLSGIIFFQIGTKDYDNMDDFNSHFGALMMVMMFSLMGSAQSVLLSFPFERPMVLREYVTGTCESAPFLDFLYFLLKIIALIRWNPCLLHREDVHGNPIGLCTDGLRVYRGLLPHGIARELHLPRVNLVGSGHGLLLLGDGSGLPGA